MSLVLKPATFNSKLEICNLTQHILAVGASRLACLLACSFPAEGKGKVAKT
jgi:hypothetical protein